MTKIMTICSAFFFLLIGVACENSTSNDNTGQEAVNKESTERKEDLAPKESKVLKFEGKVTTDDAKESIVKIDIYQNGERAVFQTLNDLELPYQADNPFFDTPTFEDLNFDGIPDLRMPESVGNANVYYAYWIYNPTSKQFEQNTEMSLSLPKVDAAKKQIMSFERNSAASYVETMYTYADGKFVLTRVENKEYIDENKYQSMIKERQEDGTMKEVRNELVEEAEG